MKWSLLYDSKAAFLAAQPSRSDVPADPSVEVLDQIATAGAAALAIMDAKSVGKDNADFVVTLVGFANPGGSPPPKCNTCASRDPRDYIEVSVRQQGTLPVEPIL